MKRVIVCGTRKWTDRKRITDRLYDLGLETENLGCTIVVGYNPKKDTPKGADRIAYQEAQKLGFLLETHPALWYEHGDDCWCPPGKEVCKAAGHRRNRLMASLGADLCIAFWDKTSTGTKGMMEEAEKKGIPVEVILKEKSDL